MLEDILLGSVAPSLLKVDAASLSAALVMRWNRKSFGDAKYKAAVEPFQSSSPDTAPSVLSLPLVLSLAVLEEEQSLPGPEPWHMAKPGAKALAKH